jgi:hypothetical protein
MELADKKQSGLGFWSRPRFIADAKMVSKADG